MSAAERIRRYLFAVGLDALTDHSAVIEKDIHDFIAQLGTAMEVSNDALYRYQVPLMSDDGSCSPGDDLNPVLFDLAPVLGGESEAATRKLKLLNILVARATMVVGSDWAGIYQRRRSVAGADILVKLAYRGLPNRPDFPLNADFARGSTNSSVGLSGQAKLIDDVAAYRAQGGAFYVCDDTVQSEFCVPILDADGIVLGIIDAEATPAGFFNADRQAAIVAMALVAPPLLP
jgi:putative methionine-R-sulfoxide reductase with GAF domain